MFTRSRWGLVAFEDDVGRETSGNEAWAKLDRVVLEVWLSEKELYLQVREADQF
jgi:hypothetical protein